MCLFFSLWWKVPKGCMALVLFFVSARTNKRQHHHGCVGCWTHTCDGARRSHPAAGYATCPRLVLGEHSNETYARNALEISHTYLRDMAHENQIQSSVLTHSADDGKYPYLCSRVEATARQDNPNFIKLPANLAGVKLAICEYADKGSQ